MFCAQCGKKVNEDMLFCPHCGSPIVPVKDDDAQEKDDARLQEALKAIYGRPGLEEGEDTNAAAEEAPSAAPEKPEVQDTRDTAVQKEDFVSLQELYPAQEESKPKSLFDSAEEEGKPQPSARSQQVRLQGHMPELNRKPATKAHASGKPSTYVPAKMEPSPDNLFMDDEEDYEYDEKASPRRKRNYEEKTSGSFFYRHIRGIVSLILMGVLALIVLMWAYSSAGQRTLAQIGASGNADVYAQLGNEAYNASAFAEAASWYAKALDRDEDNYDFAYSAGVCYERAQNSGRAEEYFKKAIALKPDDANAYVYIRALYVNSPTLPEEIAELLREGYRRTGDSRLQID